MARKVFISFLGTTDYFPSRYYRGKKFCSDVEKYVQIAALQYVQRLATWTENDCAYILLTTEAKARNWEDGNYIDRNGNPNVGLESTLKSKKFPFPCKAVTDIPEGKNEKEIWEIFKRIHDLFQDGDELYFDITHAYRYLPMLVVVLGNYSKFLDKAKVAHILYGNYEGRDKDEQKEFITPSLAPLVDLQSFSTLQDWTYAVADFVNNGNADRMFDLTYSISASLIKKGDERADLLTKLVTSIKDFAKDMQTSRGLTIVNGTNILELKKNLAAFEDRLRNDPNEASVDELLLPVFGQIEGIVDSYQERIDIRNGFQAVKWCLDHKLYQQAVTILQESVKSYFCLILKYDMTDPAKRDIVKGLLEMAKYRNSYMLPTEIGMPKGKTEWSVSMKNIASDYDSLRIIRNDLNHAGFQYRPSEPLLIEETIKEKYESIKKALNICL